jgi:hypothetical protein
MQVPGETPAANEGIGSLTGYIVFHAFPGFGVSSKLLLQE